MIAAEPQRESVHRSAVAGHQETEGVHIPFFGFSDKFGLCWRRHLTFR
jgi:hypothetical protein